MSAGQERFADVGRGITVCFEEIGDPSAPAVVLVAGLGQQLISWPEPLCEAIAAEGYRVIRFDNRDCGRSTHTDAPRPGLVSLLSGRFPAATYELYDMAADLRGLLDALGIDRAHLVGASMGGMISQTAAARYPDRVASLTSIFSTTGAKGLGRPHWSTWLKLGGPTPTSAAEAVEADVSMMRHIGSQVFPFREDRVREASLRAWERDPSAEGVDRQLAAILKTGDRTAQLGAITAPTLVVHGDRDQMIDTSGGRATAEAIPGARMWIVPGLGHDYPEELWTALTARLSKHFAHAGGSSATEPSPGAEDPVPPTGTSASTASAATGTLASTATTPVTTPVTTPATTTPTSSRKSVAAGAATED